MTAGYRINSVYCRRQRRTVSACMIAKACGYLDHRRDKTSHKQRSVGAQRGRFAERFNTSS